MFFEGIQHYNKLPRTIRLQENQRHFKKAVKKHYENEIEQLTTTAATPLTQNVASEHKALVFGIRCQLKSERSSAHCLYSRQYRAVV